MTKGNSDISKSLLENCSPYISTMVYDVESAVFYVECVDSPQNAKPVKRITFSDITQFKATGIDVSCPNTFDSIIGIHWMSSDTLCLQTEVKEIIITTNTNRIESLNL